MANRVSPTAGHSKISLLQEQNAYLGCMKCMNVGVYESGIRRMTYPGFRRWLPPDHADRTDARFGSPELRPAPRQRTHKDTVVLAAVVEQARLNGVAAGSSHDPTANSGVIGLTPLARLPYCTGTSSAASCWM